MSMAHPLRDNLVSIVTPAYKAENSINDTIRSVLEQTYPHWEMLVIDDCSPDRTREVVTSWVKKDRRVHLIAKRENGGPAAARNAGIAAATGRWLAFLDSDDVWLPQKLERTLVHAKRNASPLTFTGFRRINFNASKTGRYISVPSTITYSQLLRNTVIATSTVIVDRERVGQITMKNTYYDDFSCWLDILRPGRTAYGLNEDLMRYRIVQGSVSRDKRISASKVWRAYREIERLSFPVALWCFASYALKGYRKYRKF